MWTANIFSPGLQSSKLVVDVIERDKLYLFNSFFKFIFYIFVEFILEFNKLTIFIYSFNFLVNSKFFYFSRFNSFSSLT